MSAHPRIESDVNPYGLAEALYFESGDDQLFGWLHLPAGGKSASTGIIICKPFGYEAICSHRSIRAFAEMSASAGVPALRFDSSGCGDSQDIAPDIDQIDKWTNDVVAAAVELQKRTGVERVCALGFRLGALLAMLAAHRSHLIQRLILIGPIVNGRKHLRELRTTRLAATIGSDARAESSVASGDRNALEVSGFMLSGATIESLAKVDLVTLSVPAVSDALIVDGSSFPSARGLPAALSSQGVRVQYESLPGLVEMIMTAPQFATVPQQMLDTTRCWLEPLALNAVDHQGSGADTSSPADDASQSAPPKVLTVVDPDTPGNAVYERPVFLPTNAMLFGIVTEPRTGEARRRAVILLNAGADYHIGASRMYVSLARRWAKRGYVVLRLDLAGLGDSGTRPGSPDNEVFPPEALDDVRAAIDFLRTRYSVGEVNLMGLCSGAYHALRAAVAGLPISRILMVNPQNYFWKPGMTLNALQLAEVVRNPGVYRQNLFSRAAWRRLLGGQVNLLRIAKIFMQRPLLALESRLRDLARRLRIKLPNDLGSELQEVVKRGVRIVFIFARGEPGIDLLRIEAGSAIKQLGERCQVHIIDSADHIFSQIGPRSVMEKSLSEELFAQSPWLKQRTA